MRCKYIRKIFQNEENGYTVALFSTLDHEVPLSARDKFWADKKIIAFTAKGYDLPLTDEIEIEMEGEWETNSHGTQYKVETFLEVVPRTREGILGYLSCGSLKGIGPKTAERIVNRFGLDTLEVMEKYPQELLKIQGISQKKLDRIVDSFGKNKVFRELMTFLSPFHVTPKKANMILQKFRDQSVEIIRKQPYILCSVKGFGFLTVDAIARQCCAATNDPMRISGCVSYVLREAMKQNGHLYLEQEILVKDALKVLNKELNLQPVTETEILKNADGEIVYGSLTEETKEALGYLRELYRQEILDPDFALRAQNNIRDLVVNGKCGAFFGLWWTPNNPLMDEYRKNKEADWEPYYLTADVKRTVEVYSTFRDNKYVVVRKGYEHPEIAMKILSVLFDYSRYEAEDADEMNTYFALNVDPTARPLMINVDYNEATYIVTKHIREVLYSPGDEKTREDLSAIEASYFDACKEYLEAEVPSVEAWAAYKSRISAVGLLVDANYRAPEKKFLGDGDGEIPQTLRLLEKNAFIQIIMGRMPVSSFDSFVEDWYRKGGDSLTERVREGLVDS